MKRQRLYSGLLLGLLTIGQFSWAGAAVAAKKHNGASPSPSPSAEASASPSPEPSDSPSPSASPEPSDEPSASPSASPTPEKSDSPSPSASPKPKPKSTETGPEGCGGVIPDWVFDRASRTWQAADKGSFTCDKATGYFLSPKYFYNKRSGWYEIVPPETAAASPDLISAPNVVHTVLGDLTVGSKDYEVAKALGLLSGPGGITMSNTGSDSNNMAAVDSSSQSWMDLTNLVNVINTLQSSATSGNVNATANTQAGTVSSGTASVIANVINLLASAWSWSHGDLNFFMQNFLGNHNGDLTLSPTESASSGGGSLGSVNLNGTGSGSNNQGTVNNSSNLAVNAKDSGSITNDLNLTAKSGDVAATRNSQVGSVASGDATAEANIINLINSFITSGSSFFGILNIFGNFNGDVLFPNGFLNGAVQSGSDNGSSASLNGTGPGSNNQAGINNTGQTTVNSSAQMGVNNNVSTSAASGTAGATANTSAGNVSTGSATTQQGTFNLANTSIFGDNAVLVIVNVLGHWVGKIMSVPGGNSTNSALLTGNAQVGANATGPNSNNQASVTNSQNATVNRDSTGTITNNVKVDAQSGNAEANKNSKVGDVSTGNAKAASNVANIFNSVLDVKHWFGVLVINVFGDWLGDVNNNTAAGNPAVSPAATSGTTGLAASDVPRVGLLALVSGPGNVAAGTATGTVAGAATQATTASDPAGHQVLTAAAEQPPASQVAAAAKGKDMSILFGISAGVMLLAGALASIDRKLKLRRK